MQRFYRETGFAAEADGHRVTLDGRPVRTPGGRPLVLPSAALAGAVAAEWAAQADTVVPASMPLMQLAATAIDRVLPVRAAIVDRLAAYGETDLLCHRADSPAELVRRQAALWQPPLDWAASALAVRLAVTSGIIAIEQPAPALAALRTTLEGLEGFALAATAQAAGALGSIVLALALVHGRLTAEAAAEAGFLDEDFQADRWGRDGEATARRAALAADVAAADRLIDLAGTRPQAR